MANIPASSVAGSVPGRQALNIAAVLDHAPVGRYQIMVAVLCGLLVFLDGYDTQSIAFIAPSIAAELHLTRPELGPLFVASLLGIMVGALAFGPLSDRYGRRMVILISTAVFAVFCLASANAETFYQLLLLRFITGLGLGGAMPNAIALTAEYCPARRRATIVMLMFTGFSLGAAAAGALSAWIIPIYGWRSVLVVGGVLPLALLVVLYFVLPESIRFLVVARESTARISALLQKVSPGFQPAARYVADEHAKGGMPVVQLFRARRPVGTLLLWTVFFLNLLTNFTLQNWIPTLASDSGLPIQTAVLIGTMFQVGGVVASLVMGVPMDKLGAFRVLPVMFAVAVPVIVLLGQVGAVASGLMALTFGAGFCIVGGQNCANALAAIYYPTAVRATGVGWALGVGRIGAVIGPIVAGWLLHEHWSIPAVFMIVAIPPACAAIACFMMGVVTRDERPEVHALAPDRLQASAGVSD